MTKFVPSFAVGATLYFAEHRGAPSQKVRVQSIEFRKRNAYVTVLTLEGTPYTMIRTGLHQLYNEPECNTHAGYMQLQTPGGVQPFLQRGIKNHGRPQVPPPLPQGPLPPQGAPG
jgi:hypothetical protein